ncbi:hypothetical protein MKW92_019368 [Papaver armeniacum]|nr:hypothetical protein MKW92_019368 [Papaver armeniacum]
MNFKDEEDRDTVLPLPPPPPPPPLIYWLLPPPPVIPPNFKPEKLEPQYMKPRNQQSPGRLRISRPGVGREGKRIPLLVNHFKASVNVPDATFYQYTVSVTSEDKGGAQIKGIGRKIMDSLYQTYCSELGWKHLTYDGETSLYTVGPLPRNWFEFKVVLEETPLKRNGSPGFDIPSEIECKRLKRCSYQATKMFKVEIRFARKIPMQAIGLALKGCNTEGAVDAMRVLDIIIKQQAAESFRMKMRNEERKNEVKTVELTVYDYFTKHRKLELTTSAYMPCIDVGRPKKPNYIPLELCSLVPLQRYTKSLSAVQRSFLSEKSPKPLERIESLTDFINNSRYDVDPSLSACGVSIEKQLIPVEGRVLGTPGLKVGNNVDCFPDNGKWNYSGQTLYEPVKIQRWAVVNFSARWDTSYLSRELITGARDKGIHMDPPYSLIEEDYQSRRLPPIARVDLMFEQIKTKLPGPPELLLCVLERRNSDIYGPWKNKCLSELGIVTQCLTPAKINDLYITNVLLKINTKLGGKNSLLAVEQVPRIPLISETPTMILGMDVSHGAPGRSDVPSIAAVVGSRYWPLISRYRACVRTQSPKEEMIDSLYKPLPNGEDDGIIRELLLDFYETSNGRKPSQIVIFRDGVADSQFNQVLNVELEQIIKAFNHLGETELPKFTLVVVQKSHHTKLFKAGGSPENVPAGTVVDTVIVHPRYYDFYMCAHNGAKGTSRPAHYNVLLDEIGFSPDELQKLVHSLSYVYQRSTTAVSIVAPVCYAHHAAAQMAQFIKSRDFSSFSASNSPFRELPRLHPNVRNSMFFC